MMSNIKTIKVIKEIIGLTIGATLSRTDSNSNFELEDNRIGEGYLIQNSVSISPDIIRDEYFEVTEWFEAPAPAESKKLSSTKQLRQENNVLTKEVYYLKDDIIFLNNEIKELRETVAFHKSFSESLNQCIDKIKDERAFKKTYTDGVLSRISTKLAEYRKEFNAVANELELTTTSGERLEKLSESYTVFYNMIDLLEKVKA